MARMGLFDSTVLDNLLKSEALSVNDEDSTLASTERSSNAHVQLSSKHSHYVIPKMDEEIKRAHEELDLRQGLTLLLISLDSGVTRQESIDTTKMVPRFNQFYDKIIVQHRLTQFALE